MTKKKTKRGWPIEVIVLEAKDMRKRLLGSGEKHCLLGWIREVFGIIGGYNHASTIAGRVIEKMEKRCRLKRYAAKQSIADFNDDPKTTLEQAAKVWNQTMADIGYTEGNPEA